MVEGIRPLVPEKNNRIAVIKRVPHVSYHETPYKLAKKPRVKRTGWLARLCWKVLHWIGALEQHYEKITTYTYDTCIQRGVTNRVMFAAEAIMERGDNPDDYVVVMGENELREAWHEMDMDRGFVTMRTRQYRHGYSGTVMSLDVHAVAALVGVALIPKVLVERKVNVDAAQRPRAALRQIKTTTTVSECQKIAREALGE